jgi:hypothetical protein
MRLGWPPLALTFIRNFVKIGQFIQKLKGVTHRQHGDTVMLLFYLRKESRLMKEAIHIFAGNKSELCMKT